MTNSQPRNALQAPPVTDQPPASPASPESPAEPRPVGVPWTVRVADWSARHRWPVFVLWFVATIGLFAGSIAAGGINSAQAVSNNERGKYEAAEAFIVYNAANAGAQQTEKASSQFLLVVNNPTGTTDDPAYVTALGDITKRLGALTATVDGKTGPVFEGLVDPTKAPPEAALISPDKTTARIAARVPGDGDVLIQRLAPVPALVDQLKADYPNLAIHPLNNTLTNDEIQKLINGGLDDSLRLTLPLTFLILLIAFGAVVAAVVPLVLAIDRAARGVRDPRALQPGRRAGQPVREPARRPDRAGGRGRLLAVHDHPLPDRAAPRPAKARRDRRRQQHRRPRGVLLRARGR